MQDLKNPDVIYNINMHMYLGHLTKHPQTISNVKIVEISFTNRAINYEQNATNGAYR